MYKPSPIHKYPIMRFSAAVTFFFSFAFHFLGKKFVPPTFRRRATPLRYVDCFVTSGTRNYHSNVQCILNLIDIRQPRMNDQRTLHSIIAKLYEICHTPVKVSDVQYSFFYIALK